MNEQNNNKETYLERVLTVLIVIMVLAASSAIAFKIVYVDGKGSKNMFAINTETTSKTETDTSSTVDKIDEKRDLSSIELTEIEDWKNSPYEILQPKQMKADIENSNEETTFSYTWNGKVLFEIVTSRMNDNPYIHIENVESGSYNGSRNYDLNKWTLFKTSDNEIVFASTDNFQNGLNEEFKFVTFKEDGTAEEQINYIDLLGYDEEYDELFTLTQADCTVVRKGTTVKLVRDGKVLDEKEFPKGIAKGWHWSSESYFITDDGNLFYILLDKSNWDKPTINCVKAGKKISERITSREVAHFGNEIWRMFSDENGDDVVFTMDCEIWKDCSIGYNRIGIENKEDTHSSYQDWVITEVKLSKPETFKLEYVEDTYENTLQAISVNNVERAYWLITFNYENGVYTLATMPGIDQNIFLNKEDADKFDGKSFDIDELETVRKEVASLYDSYVEKEYENFLKN